MLEVQSLVLFLEGLQVVVGLGQVGDADLEVLARLVVDDGEFLVLHHQGAVLPLHDLQAGLALAVVAVGLQEAERKT